MDNNAFCYNYSAERNKEVEAIRKKYLPHGVDKMERLRRLDEAVQAAGMIEGLSLGVIGILIFGLAMCFGLLVFSSVWWPAIPLGILGVATMLSAYWVYQIRHEKKKAELTPEILKLTDELIGK